MKKRKFFKHGFLVFMMTETIETTNFTAQICTIPAIS